MYGKKILVHARACLVRRPCAHKAVQSCARSCAQPCAPALCAVVRVRSNVVRREVACRSCAHTTLALAAVHKYKDLCASHCTSIGKSVHNLFSSGTMLWSCAVFFLIVFVFHLLLC